MIEVKKERVLLEPKDFVPSSDLFEVIGVINPAAIRVDSGEIVLYVRVIERLKKSQDENFQYSPRMIGKEKFEIVIDRFSRKEAVYSSDLEFSFADGTKRLKFISHFRRVVLSQDGFRVKKIEQKPSFFGLGWDGELGVEDARITKINELYVMTYVALSSAGNITTNLAVSNDCLNWYRRGIIFSHQNKDVVIFPERINHQYLALNRPEGDFEFSLPHVLISYSENLEFWGKPGSLKLSKKKSWDSGKVGAGPPPIKTKKGWLFIYHGVIDKKISSGNIIVDDIRKLLGYGENIRNIYCAGAALLDFNNPRKVLARVPRPFLVPHKKYERGTFETKDVVFPTGLVLDRNEEDILLFSGGGDVVTTVKKISLKEIFAKMKRP
jgi:beta-1,2-mannobiose phosphorylase / 1,2-beta-oligomannan phosphorylase